MEELKDRLATALALRKVKPADMARDLDIPRGAISQYLSGKIKNMDGERFYKVANYLYVDYAWLLGYDVPMHSTPTASREEELLLDLFRHLNSDGQYRVFEYINMLNNSGFKNE